MQGMKLNKGSKEVWNCMGNGDSAEVLEGSPLWNMLCYESQTLHDCNKDHSVLYKQDLSVGPGPLGLHLRKSASLVNLIQIELDHQASKEKGRYKRSDTYYGVLDTTSLTKTIPKPSHFYASFLRIGTWEWKPRYDGDLVAKFYYTNGKLIWEILNRGLKSKIEIKWEIISALKVNCQENEPGTLEIMLSKVPIFCKETNPEPRKSTQWLRTIDFTDGQASMHRRHFLQCAPGILDEHIMKLLSNNQRLYSLSQKNTIDQRDALFEQFHSDREVAESSESVQDLHCHYNYPQFEQQQFVEPVSMSIETNTVRRNHTESQDTMHVLIPSSVPVSNKHTMTPSADLQFHRDMFNCNKCSSSQMPPTAQLDTWNGRILDDSIAHYKINPGKPPQRNLLTSIGASASNLVSPEDVRNFIKETRPTNQSISSRIPFNCHDDSLTQNTREFVSVSNYAFNYSRSLPGSDDAQSRATLLEKISHDLLNDTYSTEATADIDEPMIMSSANSFSSFLLQDPSPATVHSAGCDPPVNIEDEAPSHVLDVAPPGSSVGEGDNDLLPSTNMENAPWEWEHEPVWDIDMDMEFLLDFPLFSP